MVHSLRTAGTAVATMITLAALSACGVTSAQKEAPSTFGLATSTYADSVSPAGFSSL
jgi:hypothetical protein